MLFAFGDESSDEKKERVFAVGAVFGEQYQWEALAAKWRARLPDGIDFHAAECDADLGPFADFSHQENKALYKDLTQLLVESQLLGYGVAIDLIQQKKYIPDILPESSYYRCLAEIVVFFAHKAAFYVPRKQVKFTFDRRLESQVTSIALYDYMVKLPEWEDSWYLSKDIEFSSRSSVGIQVADLFTRELMKRLDNEIGPQKRPIRKSMLALEATKRFGGTIYTGEWAKNIRAAIQQLDSHHATAAFRPGHY